MLTTSRTTKGKTYPSLPLLLWMVVKSFEAPPEKAWNERISDRKCNTNAMVSTVETKWCEMDSVSPQYGSKSVERNSDQPFDLLDFRLWPILSQAWAYC